MEFKVAGLDKPAYVVTVLLCSFIILLDILFIFMVPYGWAFALGILLIPVIVYLLKPQSYSIAEGRLTITKMIGTKITISLDKVKAYTVIQDFSTLRVSRLFGNGGLFGYYGIFSTAEYGMINCQLTHMKNIVLLKTSAGTYAISPADVPQFTTYLSGMIAHPEGRMEKFEPLPQNATHPASALILLLPILLFLITVGIMVLGYVTLPDRIPVHFDVHGDPDRYGSRISYLISTGIPSTILLLIAFAAFFTVRRTTQNNAIPNLLVIIVAFIQLFIGYISLDRYWMTQYGNHILPLVHTFVIFGIIMLGLFLYYRRVVTPRQ